MAAAGAAPHGSAAAACLDLPGCALVLVLVPFLCDAGTLCRKAAHTQRPSECTGNKLSEVLEYSEEVSAVDSM